MKSKLISYFYSALLAFYLTNTFCTLQKPIPPHQDYQIDINKDQKPDISYYYKKNRLIIKDFNTKTTYIYYVNIKDPYLIIIFKDNFTLQRKHITESFEIPIYLKDNNNLEYSITFNPTNVLFKDNNNQAIETIILPKEPSKETNSERIYA